MGLAKSERRRFRDAAGDCGMGIILNGGVSNLSVAAPGERTKAIETAKGAISTAEEVGATIWSGIIYGNWLDVPNKPLTHSDRETIWDRAVGSVREISNFANDCA
jgi:sugar phosphate isomerase/epimerase